MTTAFSDEEVIRRTAKRLRTNETNIRNMLDAYADEFIRHARETDVSLIQPPMTEAPKAEVPKKASRVRATTGKPARKRTPSKATTTTPDVPGEPDKDAEGVPQPNTDTEAEKVPAGSPS